MASRERPKDPTEPFLQGADAGEYQTAPDEEAFTEVERLQSEAGPDSGFVVSVFRKSQDGLKYNYIARLPLVGFSIDKLPTAYGGGDYLLRVQNERNRIVKAIRITFDPGVHPVNPSSSAPAAAPTSPVSDPSLQAILLKLSQDREDDRKNHQHFLETMVTALLTRGQGNLPTLPELMDAQLKMRELAAPAGKTDGDLVLQALKLGLETATGRTPGEGGEGDGEVLSKLVDKIALPLFEAITRRSAPRPAPNSLPGPGSGQLPLSQGQNGVRPGNLPPELEPYRFLKRYTVTLLGWAKTNFDPERVAAAIYNLLPDEFFPVLEMFLNRPATERFSILVQLDPRLQAYQTYLEAVTTALQNELNLDTGDGEDKKGRSEDSATGE
ncbi:MAG: hypothetical protein ACREB3_00790 [Burkholderiales bacterium]